MHFEHLSSPHAEQALAEIKKAFPKDQRLQSITIADVKEYSKGRAPDGSTAEAASGEELAQYFPNRSKRVSLTPCEEARINVVVDVFFLVTGAVPLAAKISGVVKETLPTVLAGGDGVLVYLDDFQEVAEVLGDSDATLIDKLKAGLRVIRAISKGGQLGMLWGVITRHMTWYDFVLYSVAGLAEIFALFAQPEIAIPALAAQEGAQLVFLAVDARQWAQACWPASRPVGHHPEDTLRIVNASSGYVFSTNKTGAGQVHMKCAHYDPSTESFSAEYVRQVGGAPVIRLRNGSSHYLGDPDGKGKSLDMISKAGPSTEFLLMSRRPYDERGTISGAFCLVHVASKHFVHADSNGKGGIRLEPKTYSRCQNMVFYQRGHFDRAAHRVLRIYNAHSGYVWHADSDGTGGLQAKSEKQGDYNMKCQAYFFENVEMPGGQRAVRIRNPSGHYATATNGGHGHVDMKAPTHDDTQVFLVDRLKPYEETGTILGAVTFRSLASHYFLHADWDGRSTLRTLKDRNTKCQNFVVYALAEHPETTSEG